MIALPKELAPWSALLGLFPADLAGDVGRMVPRLALAVGPMRAARPRLAGEPDGFDGIARRGSYERLLLTEWLLADEAPDEFARRAAMGEHAFLQIQRRSPVRSQSSVAVFEAGPGQLGAPRIAQLAALIVLATRAERAGARFVWGILGEPDAPPVEAVTNESVTRLLHARAAAPASDRDVAAWAARAAAQGWDDVWIVGARPPDTAWRHATLEIHDVLDPQRSVLTAVARVPPAPPRAVELELPEPRAVVRLLRDPFAVTAAAPRRTGRGLTPASNLVFAEGGAKLFARSAAGEVIAYPVPNSPSDGGGQPKRYRPRAHGVVAAVGWVQRGLVMLTVTNQEIVLEHTNTRGPALLRSTFLRGAEGLVTVSQPGDPLAPLVYRGQEGPDVLFLDARRALFRLVPEAAKGAAPALPNRIQGIERIASEVAAMAVSPSHVVLVARDPERDGAKKVDTPRMGILTCPAGRPGLDAHWHVVILRRDGRPSTKEVVVGNGTFEAQAGNELAAVHRGGEAWTLFGVPIALSPPAGARVVGVWQGGSRDGPALLVLDADHRTLSLVGRASVRSLPRAASPIVDVTLHAWRAQLAYVTAAGEVVIHSLYTDTPLARFLPEG